VGSLPGSISHGLPAHHPRELVVEVPYGPPATLKSTPAILIRAAGCLHHSIDGNLRRGRQLHGAVPFEYNLRTRQLQRWKLPKLRLKTKGLGREPVPVGVFGYSAHTGYMAFWIAAWSINCENEKGLWATQIAL
jgi:hypothetical protein